MGILRFSRTIALNMGRLHSQVVRAANLPDVRHRIESAGNDVIANSPQVFAEKFHADVQKFKKLAQEAKLPYQD
jgi:hypothetical protein